jgi:hypothetical protein
VPQNYFLIIGNGRTGSSWLLTSLDRLADVTARREIKWPIKDPEDHPIRLIWERDASAKAMIAAACSGSGACCIGSKLIFDPYWFMDAELFREIASRIDHDVRVIILKRRYVETWLSWKVRGVYHRINRALANTGHGDAQFIARSTAKEMPQPLRLVLTHNGKPLSDPEGARHYDLADALDDMLVHFCNDLHALEFTKERRQCVLDYTDIGARLTEIAKFIGSQAPPAEVARVRFSPLTEKLPALSEYVKPLEPLSTISAALDEAFWSLVVAKSGGRVWRWPEAGIAEIALPNLRSALSEAGVETRWGGPLSWIRRDGAFRWKVRKPVISMAA